MYTYAVYIYSIYKVVLRKQHKADISVFPIYIHTCLKALQ